MPSTTPLLPVEQRLLTPFSQPGLDAIRRTLLARICEASTPELRVRAITITAHWNDFRPVLADVLPVPANILAEATTKPRSLFALNLDFRLLRADADVALHELTNMGLSKAYADLIFARITSHSPQHYVSALSAILLLAALLNPLALQPMILVTEASDPLTAENTQQFEV